MAGGPDRVETVVENIAQDAVLDGADINAPKKHFESKEFDVNEVIARANAKFGGGMNSYGRHVGTGHRMDCDNILDKEGKLDRIN